MASITEILMNMASQQAKTIGQQQENQYSSIRNKFAPEGFKLQNQLTQGQINKIPAEIRGLLADAAYKEMETKYVPTKYDIERQNANTSSLNADISNRTHSPEMLDAQLQNLKSLIGQRNSLAGQTKGMSPLAKAKYERQSVEQQLKDAEESGDEEGAASLRKDLALAKQQELKQGVDADIHRRGVFYGTTIKTLDQINKNFGLIASFAGLKGEAAANYQSLATNLRKTNPEAYNAYVNYVQSELPVAAEQLRASYKTSITPEMQKLLTDVIDFTKAGNYDGAVAKWVSVNKLIREEARPYVEAIGETVNELDTSAYAPGQSSGVPPPGSLAAIEAERKRRSKK